MPGPVLDTESQTPLEVVTLDPDTASWDAGDAIVLDLPNSPDGEVFLEDIDDQVEPSAPGSAVIFRQKNNVTTSGNKSNVLEGSVAQSGRFGFYTGNWIAARTNDGGNTWGYRSPYADMSDFCCDQVTLFDPSRNILLWYRQGVKNASGSNRLRLGVSKNGGNTWCFYNTKPTDTNGGWTGQWWDYPHLQLGADYLYISTNVFNNSDQWTRSVMLRWPLDSLRTCSGFSYNYFQSTNWSTFVPVQGADHDMYWASNWPTSAPQNSRLRIWQWPENSTTISAVNRSVTAWSFTDRGDAVCGSSSGNWAGRTDPHVAYLARATLSRVQT